MSAVERSPQPGASVHTAEPAAVSRAVLVSVSLGGSPVADASLHELALLAESAGDVPVARLMAKRPSPDPALFIGSGKADELKRLIGLHQATCVIFDQALSPVQQRNLGRHLGVDVFDRIFLILEIFARRAQSHEGKLQVELARMQYLSTRLVGRWSHLERQRGGFGLRGGPGETQIELDRRMIDRRIKVLRSSLMKVKRQRDTQRRARVRQGVFRVSLVGYTNAGKSTLFNALSKGHALAADQLFATLDTKTKQVYIQEAGCAVALSDTVGFIRDLPHTLIDAFGATLQEATDADLLIHVVDAASEARHEEIQEVLRVLAEIAAEGTTQILFFNKADLLGPAYLPPLARDRVELQPGRWVSRVWGSAEQGLGLAVLRQLMAEHAQSAGLPETCGDGAAVVLNPPSPPSEAPFLPYVER